MKGSEGQAVSAPTRRAQLRHAVEGWPRWRLSLALIGTAVGLWGPLVCVVLGWLTIFGVLDLRLGGLALTALVLFLAGSVLRAASRWVDQDEDGEVEWFEPPRPPSS